MIYVPEDLPYSACHVLQSNYVLRVYENTPTYNSTINYVEVALDNHYIWRTGTTTFSNYSTLPTCISSSRITNAWIYRTDIFDILGCIAIIGFFIYWCLSKPIKWLFRGWF